MVLISSHHFAVHGEQLVSFRIRLPMGVHVHRSRPSHDLLWGVSADDRTVPHHHGRHWNLIVLDRHDPLCSNVLPVVFLVSSI